MKRAAAALLSLVAACQARGEPVAPAGAPGALSARAAPSAIRRERVEARDGLLDQLTSRFPEAERPACSDAPLRLRFRRPFRVGERGRISVFRAAGSDPEAPAAELVASVDLAADSYRTQIAGRVFQQMRPIFVDGLEASVYLPRGSLAPGSAYHVTIDAGVFVGPSGEPLGGVTTASGFRFRTRAAAPRAASELRVSRDDEGDYCSVQGAVDALPPGGGSIRVAPGTYHELVLVRGKSGLTLRGEDRKRSILSYPNNDVLQLKLGSKYRALLSIEDSRDVRVEQLTLHNTTPQGGSQAEALRVDGGERVSLRELDLLSLQDTLQLSGSVYVADSYIEGNVDFVWGKGAAYIERSELRTVGKSGYVVQSRNGAGYGFVFVDSKLSAEAGITGTHLARIEADRFPHSQVAFIDCQLGPHVSREAWQSQTPGADTGKLRFWEHGSRDLAGQPLSVSGRAAFSRQLTAAEALRLRDRAVVLGGWNPGP